MIETRRWTGSLKSDKSKQSCEDSHVLNDVGVKTVPEGKCQRVVHFWALSTHNVIPFTTTRGSDWIVCINMSRADGGTDDWRLEEMRGAFSSSCRHFLQILVIIFLLPRFYPSLFLRSLLHLLQV